MFSKVLNFFGIKQEIFQYKKEKSFEERKQLADEELKTLPNHIPIVLQRSPKAHIQGVDSQRLSMPDDTNIYGLVDLAKVRNQLTEESIVIYAKGHICGNSLKSNLREFYEANKDEDGILYLLYANANSAHVNKYLS